MNRLDWILETLLAALAIAALLYIFAHMPPRKYAPTKQPVERMLDVAWSWEGCWWHVDAEPFSQDESDFDCAV